MGSLLKASSWQLSQVNQQDAEEPVRNHNKEDFNDDQLFKTFQMAIKAFFLQPISPASTIEAFNFDFGLLFFILPTDKTAIHTRLYPRDISTVTEVVSVIDFSSYLNTLPPSTLLVIYFYTQWTEFSTQMSSDISTFASRCPVTDPPTISFIRIDAKALVNLAVQYSVSVTPHVLCLRDGQVVESIRDSDPIKVCNALERRMAVDGLNVLSKRVGRDCSSKQPKEAKEALVERLTGLINRAPIMLFMKGTSQSPLCRFSRRIIVILNKQNIEYDSFDVLADEDVRQGLKEVGDWPTFPQLWVDGQLIGGLEIVSAFVHPFMPDEF